jgi:hypothetical protein
MRLTEGLKKYRVRTSFNTQLAAVVWAENEEEAIAQVDRRIQADLYTGVLACDAVVLDKTGEYLVEAKSMDPDPVGDAERKQKYIQAVLSNFTIEQLMEFLEESPESE